MKRILTLIIVVAILHSCGSRNLGNYEFISRTDYYYDANGRQGAKKADYFVLFEIDKAEQESEEKHGSYREYYESGELKQEANYKRNELEGLSKTYYENGQVAEISNWVNDQYQGVYKYYFENGGIQQELKYVNDLLNGPCKVYYDNGNLKNEINYKDDLLWELIANYDSSGNKLDSLTIVNGNGQLHEYYPNGQLETKARVVTGLLNGSFEFFSQDGKLRMKTTYLEGQKHGDLKNFHENGEIAQQSFFYKDINTGHQKYYNDKGVLIGETIYKSPPFNKTDSIELNLGKYEETEGLMGLVNSLFSGGIFNGIKNGPEKRYYDSGQLKSEAYFRNNIQDSLYREYYLNGKIHSETLWRDGHSGPVYSITFDKEGNLLDSITNLGWLQ